MTTSELPWPEANQRLLVAEFARLKARLAGEAAAPAEAGVDSARAALSEPAAIDRLSNAFGLSPFERDLLLLCAGVEMDAALAASCAGASAAGRPFASFGLGLAALAEPHWSALAPVSPLRLWRLLELKDEQALSTSRLTVDERVLHYLAGVNYLDTRLRPLLRACSPPTTIAETHSRVVDSVVLGLEGGQRGTLLQFVGNDSAGQRDVAALVAERLGLRLYQLASGAIPSGWQELEALSVLWYREAVLLDGALLVACDDSSESAAVAARFCERCKGVVFVATRKALTTERATHPIAVNKPGAADQRQLWAQVLGPEGSRLNGALDRVATHFRFSADTIQRTGQAVLATMSTASGAGSDRSQDAALWQACRGSVRGRLDDLSQRIESNTSFDDLVLSDANKATLRQIAAQVKHRFEVYDRWGFSGKGERGLGISALFAGDSGTGKTMAAEVLASELHLDLYRIDLASTVSKYIGETEKNLSRLFDAAEESGAILLFDEADALFGKRSEVKDSHDRYANIEVSYLLQRMEAYRGLAILTTNQSSALDTAFARRLRFVLQFPFPDHAEREHIWRRVFPAATPLNGLDYGKLARLSVAGGTIRNIALSSAFLAAQAHEPVGMAHLLQAARTEAVKRDRSFSDAETRGWV